MRLEAEGSPAPHQAGPYLLETSTMRRIATILIAATMALMPAAAAAQMIAPNPGYLVDRQLEGIGNLSNTGYTNATTTATILPGTAVTIPATGFDPAKRLVQVCFSADATKSTSGTGAVGIAQDGVPIVASYRYTSSAAGRNTPAGCYAFFRTTQLATTISLYAVSSDTASFAVQNAQAIVTQWRFN